MSVISRPSSPIIGRQAGSGSAASGKEKNSTQTKRNQQPCLFVSGDGREYGSHNLTTSNVHPSAMDSVVSTPPSSWHMYSDQRLPLSANQDQFVLTDSDYFNHQDSISRANEAISFHNPLNESSTNNYANLQYVPQQFAHPPSIAHHGVATFDPVALWDNSTVDVLVTGAQGGDPFMPLPRSHSDDDVMIDFPMDTGVDVLRHAGGVEGMDVLDQLDLSALGDFPCLPNDMDLIDPVSLSPTIAPLQSSELAGFNFLPTLIPIQSSDVPAPSVPIVAPSAAVFPANVQAVVPPPIVPSAAHHQTGDIGDCLQLLKLMKPSKSTPKNTPVETHQATPCTHPVDSPQMRAPAPFTAPFTSIGTGWQCCHDAQHAWVPEQVFVITDSAVGMRKSPAMFCAHLFSQLQEAASRPCSLPVVCDRRAKLPVATVEGNRLVLKIPKDCVRLDQWALQCRDIRERVLVVQEIINTLADIHAGGDMSEVSCYEQEVNPITFDQLAVIELVKEVMSSFSHHQLLSAPLARKLSDIARGMVSQMMEAARVLGEKRLCKLAIACPGGTVEVYCLEQEKLMDALQQVKKFLPGTVSSLWGAYWMEGLQHVRSTEMSTPDRNMVFTMAPQTEQVSSSNKFVFIRANF
eukprot:Em0004g43a